MFTRVHVFLSALVIAAAAFAPTVQAQKIGYTNQQLILSNMPRMQEVQKKLQQEAQQQQKELQRERQRFQKKMQQFQQQQSLLDDSARSSREQELRQMQQELQRSQQKRQQNLRQREQELMQPLLKDLQNAIDQVASAQNIDLVLQSQALLHVNQNSDSVVNITQDVAQELGIQLNQTPSTPSPSVNPGQTPQGGGQ